MSVSVPRPAYTHRYEVPVVLPDFPPAEALQQCFDSLNQLNNVVNDVFTRLSDRVKHQRAKIQNVVQRVDNAQQTITKVTAMDKKATRIFSSNKYPAPKVLPDFSRIFPETDPNNPLRNAPPSTYTIPNNQKREACEPVEVGDMFIELTLSAQSRREKDFSEAEAQDGLGRLPASLAAVSSILLFNSDENPYKKYSTLDNLEGLVNAKERQQEKTNALFAAPISLIEGTELPSFAGMNNIFYQPQIEQLPTFAAPANLPLQGLADIGFDMPSNLPSIAPSVATLSNLPTFDNLLIAAPPVSNKQPNAPNSLSSAPSSTTAAPIPPISTVLSSGPSIPAAPVPAAPPAPDAPPAPPAPDAPDAPPAPDAPDAPSAPSASAPKEVPKEAQSGGRASLMDAIRNAGMKKLKKVGDKSAGPAKSAVKAKKEEKAKATALDFMSALRMRLQERHNVISGKSDREEKKAGSSAPPPMSRTNSISIPKKRPVAAAPVEDAAEADEEKAPAPAAKKAPLKSVSEDTGNSDDEEEKVVQKPAAKAPAPKQTPAATAAAAAAAPAAAKAPKTDPSAIIANSKDDKKDNAVIKAMWAKHEKSQTADDDWN